MSKARVIQNINDLETIQKRLTKIEKRLSVLEKNIERQYADTTAVF